MKRFLTLFVIALIAMPLAITGCKGKVEQPTEQGMEMSEATSTGDQLITTAVTEPAQTVATETIPPTAAPQVAVVPTPTIPTLPYTNQDIQKALKAAGIYTGPIDGIIGPKTKAAIESFQRSKGLKVDGKVGPKTWAEMAKYLKPTQ